MGLGRPGLRFLSLHIYAPAPAIFQQLFCSINMFDLSLLFRAPDVNPINRKARSIPVLNPFDLYGRVFFFAWFGFMIAFWSW